MLTKTGLSDKEDNAITNTEIQKAKKVEKVIEAAGASKHEVYKTKYTDIVSVKKQVKTIVDSMTKGR